MAKFRGARAALTTAKSGKKKAASPATNRFSVLELEEPYEYFPLLELPQELRDQIFDEVVRQRDSRYGRQILAEIRVDQDGVGQYARPSMEFAPYSLTPDIPSTRGNRALRFVSKQIRHEYQAAMRRGIPLYVSIELTRRSSSDSLRFWRGLFEKLPTTFQRLYLENDASNVDFCTLHDTRVQEEIRDDPRFSRLEGYLESCSLLTELVIEWCLEECCSPHRVTTSDAIRPILIQAVEALPNLQKYVIRTCYADVYASRRKGEEWSDPTVLRKVVTDFTFPSEEWREFIRDMGGDIYCDYW